MPRSRNLKPGFFKNEDLVALGYEAMLCFAGLWTLADREGRLEDRPKRIKAEIFPYTDADVDALLNSLAGAGFIRRYSVVDSSMDQVQPKVEPNLDQTRIEYDYLVIHTWFKHQRPHYKEARSIIPPPPAASKSNKSKQKSEYESTTAQTQSKYESSSNQVRPKVDSSMDQSKRFLPSDSLSSDSLSLDSLGDTPLPPSETETAKEEAARLDELQKRIDAEYGPERRRDHEIERIPAGMGKAMVEVPPEPGTFDVQNGWRKILALYPNQTGIEPALREYLSQMARLDAADQDILQGEIIRGIERWLISDAWRNRETGDLEPRFIPSLDKFLGVPKEGDPSRGRRYLDNPPKWEAPADPQPKRDKGSYLRDQIGGTPT